MKITRDYILGLGSGLVVIALIMFAMQWSGIGVVSEIQDNKAQSGLQQDTAAEANASSVNSTENNPASSQEIRFIVPHGASASSISVLLEQQGIITDKQAFMDAAGQLNVANKLQIGTFTLQKGLSVYEIIAILIQNPK